METPALPPPDNDRDREVLSKLSQIRDQLVLLKTDRTTYLRSQEVIPLYNETVEQVLKLDNLGFVDGKPQTQRKSPRLPRVVSVADLPRSATASLVHGLVK